MKFLRRVFWNVRYLFYTRDVYKPLREGRGSKENPLSLEDLKPLQKALNRLEYH